MYANRNLRCVAISSSKSKCDGEAEEARYARRMDAWDRVYDDVYGRVRSSSAVEAQKVHPDGLHCLRLLGVMHCERVVAERGRGTEVGPVRRGALVVPPAPNCIPHAVVMHKISENMEKDMQIRESLQGKEDDATRDRLHSHTIRPRKNIQKEAGHTAA